MHRDYSFSGSIIINQYEDRIEFVSLGGLVSGISLEAIYAGASQSRNEKLANLFYRMKLIESYGTGVSKIRNSYKEYDVQPEFYSAEDVFRVTLPNVNYIENLKNGKNTKNIVISLDEDSKNIVEFIKKNGEITRKDVEIVCNVKSTKATKLINTLIDNGVINKVGSGKNTVYVLG